MKTETETYNVSRYFDDVFECIIVSHLTKDEAKKKARELNDEKPRAYVQYLIRKE
jgi:hypothetical protein